MCLPQTQTLCSLRGWSKACEGPVHPHVWHCTRTTSWAHGEWHLKSMLVAVFDSVCGRFTLGCFSGSPCKVGISRAAPRCQQLLPSSLSWLLLEDSVLLCVLAQDFTQVAACCLTNGGSPGSCFIGWWWNGAGSSGGKTGSVSYPQPAPCLPSEAAHVVLPRLCYHLPTSLAQLSTPRAGRQPAAPGIRWAVTDWHAIKTAALPFSNSTFPSFSCSFLLPERLDFHLLL